MAEPEQDKTEPQRIGVRSPSKVEQSRRKPGILRGKIWMAPDFDTLPPDVLAAMEDEEN